MEFILVNSVKLKIMLSPQDMKEFGLAANAPESAFSRAALRKLLDRANSETGFDTKHAKLYVQAFPAPDGSLELFLNAPKQDFTRTGGGKERFPQKIPVFRR